MALSKIQAESMNLADTYAFSGTVSGIDRIGVGQTWQSVTSSRAVNTTYTNSTDAPIFVTVTATPTTSHSYLSFTESDGGATYILTGNASSTTNIYPVLSFIVPAGSTYRVKAVGTIGVNRWGELR